MCAYVHVFLAVSSSPWGWCALDLNFFNSCRIVHTNRITINRPAKGNPPKSDDGTPSSRLQIYALPGVTFYLFITFIRIVVCACCMYWQLLGSGLVKLAVVAYHHVFISYILRNLRLFFLGGVEMSRLDT